MKIALLVSGGVDSSVVLYQLKEAGYSPVLFYLQIGEKSDCSIEEDLEIISCLAKKYACTMEVVYLHKEYWDNIVNYMFDSIRRGFTPNPDILCNKIIKFGIFEQKCGYEFDKIATGHYATVTKKNKKLYLSTAFDKIKDQTYFLGQIYYTQLSKLMFPIGCLKKKEVRLIAIEQNFPNALRKDSQGICFLEKINYNNFIRKHLGEKIGTLVEFETGKIMGNHKGHWFYTIGQRKGLCLSRGPWFVVKKDVNQNLVYISNGYNTPLQYGKIIYLQNFHFITQDDCYKNFINAQIITFKIRHTPEFIFGIIQRIGNCYRIKSKSSLQGIAAGQFAVVYDATCQLCLGSGMIINKLNLHKRVQ